jgi:hypothetical protein
MRRGTTVGALLVVLLLLIAAPGLAAAPSGRVVFPAQGDLGYSFVVPADVGYVHFMVRGASGEFAHGGDQPGSAAIVTGTLPLVPGTVLSIFAARSGAGMATGGEHGTSPGDNPGYSGGDGGGSSGITTDDDVLVIAGGGGGAGGAGGDDSGQDGGGGGDAGIPDAFWGQPGDEGGTPNTHGLVGGCGGCESGSHGGEGDSVHEGVVAASGGGGGGGAGLNGGAGGQDGFTGNILQDNGIGGSGGGGGSSYVVPQALDVAYDINATCTADRVAGCDGEVILTWGGTPKRVVTSTGDGQHATVGRPFAPMTARVLDGDGVPLSDQTVTFTVPSSGPSGSFGGHASATAVTNFNGVATISGLTAGAQQGRWALQATVAGVPDPAVFTQTNDPIVTATALASSANPAGVLDPPTLTARVASAGAPPTGSVSFHVDGRPIAPTVALDGSGVATLAPAALPALGVGGHTITAYYLGDAGHATSSATISQSVTPAPTALTLTASPNPSPDGDAMTLRAALTPAGGAAPTGTVTFSDGATSLGSAALDASGVAELAVDLALGAHDLSAAYPGDARFTSATGTTVANVDPAATTTLLSVPANPVAYGAATTLLARVFDTTGPVAAGTVSVQVDGAPACPATAVSAAGEVSCPLAATLAPGAHDVTASYSGAGGSVQPSAGALTLVVRPARSTTAVAVSPATAIFGQALLLAADVSGESTVDGTVAFAIDGTPIGSPVALVGGTATLLATCDAPVPVGMPCPLAVGAHVVEAAFSSSSSGVSDSHTTTTATVDRAATATTVTAGLDPVSAGTPVSFRAEVTTTAPGSPIGRVQFLVDGRALGDAVAVSSGRATSPPTASLAPGSHTIEALFLAADPYATSQGTASLQVNPAPPPTPSGGGGSGASSDPVVPAPVAPPAPAPPTPSGAPLAPRLDLHGGRLLVDAHGSFVLAASCTGPAGTICRERVALRRAGAATLATRLVSLRAGHREDLRWDLSRSGEQLLRRRAAVEASWRRAVGDERRFTLIGTRAPAVVPRALRATRRGARVRLSCPAGTIACRATVHVRADGRTAGTTTVTLAPGRSAMRSVRLRAWARGALPARVRVTARSTVPVGRARTVARMLRVTR